MPTPPYSAMFDQWENYQKSYLDAWRSMAETAIPGKLPGNPWTDALDKWWQTFSNQSAPASQQMFAMLVEQGKTFFNLASTINGPFGEAMKIQSNGGDWENVISKSFDGLRDTLAAGASSIPMELWRKFVTERFQSPEDLLPNFIKQLQDHRNQILSMPAIGQSREKQELLQKLAREVSEYQVACGGYMEVHTKIGKFSVDLLQKKVVEKFNNKDYPQSYRAIYDLWVDCYEEVYAEAVMQPEYNKAYSDMVNALMSLTLSYRMLLDDTLEAQGMPSRRELDTLHRRFQEERRQKHIMRTEIESLKEQMNQLTEKTRDVAAPVAEKPAESESKPASPKTSRRTSTRRTTAGAGKSTSISSTK